MKCTLTSIVHWYHATDIVLAQIAKAVKKCIDVEYHHSSNALTQRLKQKTGTRPVTSVTEFE
jgi:hypothetical protein